MSQSGIIMISSDYYQDHQDDQDDQDDQDLNQYSFDDTQAGHLSLPSPPLPCSDK